ncbi:hypothetical protein CLV58_119102 [Spirosoma oryzae]|uniref:Uncharacterized protein n=1 Tax=Spirosoma oryzae TaxID=1469603 RepID=A0A2T0SKL7_9BACT|nr:hypothetical protein CLV58_119102 [Spirosoma oryzae]
MYSQTDTYQIILCVVTLGVTLTAGFLMGILTSEQWTRKTRPQKVRSRFL